VENTTNFTYSRTEKLKSKILFEKLFSEGKNLTIYPLRLVYVKTELKDGVLIKVGVSVSKRKFKSAVKRNRIKRVLREAYRHNKSMLFNNSLANYALLFLYLGKELPNSKDIDRQMIALLEKFSKKEGEQMPNSTTVETKPNGD
tara:strand:+ start:113211 stop:113642 length:432 start_codon:yes stop_codon:yes gene_type:complete